MRNYIRKRGSRPHLTGYMEEDMKRAVTAVRRGLSLGKAAAANRVPKSTLHRKVRNEQQKKSGGQLGLSADTENRIVDIIEQVAAWKVAFDGYDVRLLVKHFLDKEKIKHRRFKSNMPGEDWLRRFLNRHDLVMRNTDNVKPQRFEIGEDDMNDFYDELQLTLINVPATNIFNFDETNLADDPARRKCIVRRGFRRIESKVVNSKVGFSVMFSGSADGLFLPPMVVYKAASENVFNNWTRNGPEGTAYGSTTSGWFNTVMFENWFFKVFLPHARTLAGPKVLIGDNLACHFSLDVIRACRDNEIRFTTLIPNSTHMLQPLDIAVFRPLKRLWRKVLEDWRRDSRSRKCLTKACFPDKLKKVFSLLKPSQIISGFRGTGIFPLNREKGLLMLAGKQQPSNVTHSLNSSAVKILRDHCRRNEVDKKPARGKKINRVPGQAIIPEEEDQDIWTCFECKEDWQVDDNRWIVCDLCDKPYHLQCSGVSYRTKDYYSLDIEKLPFSCDACS